MDIRKLSRKKLRYLLKGILNKSLNKDEIEICNKIVEHIDDKKNEKKQNINTNTK